MTVNLFYLAKPKYGGWVTYIIHLYKALEFAGFKPRIFKVANSFETKSRPFGGGLTYQNTDLEAARHFCTKNFSLIAAMELTPEYMEKGKALLELGTSIVWHGCGQTAPEEYIKSLKNLSRISSISVRETIKNLSLKRGMHSTYMPHPYVASNPAPRERDLHAVSMSRLDWVKKIEFMVEANQLLQKEQRVQIYGFENNQYTFNKLTTPFPNWRDDYKGKLEPGDCIPILNRSRFLVDMTQIAEDGGGTQYTFLEAFDAGAVLVVNRRWLDAPGCILVEGENCLAAGDGPELAACLKRDWVLPRFSGRARNILRSHSSEALKPFLEAFVQDAQRRNNSSQRSAF